MVLTINCDNKVQEIPQLYLCKLQCFYKDRWVNWLSLCILPILKFTTHYFNFHLLTTSVKSFCFSKSSCQNSRGPSLVYTTMLTYNLMTRALWMFCGCIKLTGIVRHPLCSFSFTNVIKTLQRKTRLRNRRGLGHESRKLYDWKYIDMTEKDIPPWPSCTMPI